MTPSSEFFAIRDAAWPSLELEFPEGAGIRALPPLVSLERYIRLNRQLRRWFPAGLRSPEERWQAKTREEFRL